MGWDSTEIKKNGELPKNNWQLGYFITSYEGNGEKNWTRNFNELRVRDMALFALGNVNGKKILDIGCGSGIYLDILARMGAQVSGQDISAEYVKDAIMNLRENKFEADIKAGDAVKLLFNDNYFDAVFSADFFEHITAEQKNKVLAEAYRVLRPGGALVIKTPNLGYLKISIWLKRICAMLTFKSPFNIFIAHTHNNPDNQHCGLTSFTELEKFLFDNMFHVPKIIYVPLKRKKLPGVMQKLLYEKKCFTDTIIIKTRKPLFCGFFS